MLIDMITEIIQLLADDNYDSNDDYDDKDKDNKNLERIGVHDGMGDRSPNQLLAELTAH